MSRVIRVSDETFARLQEFGTGFTGSERGTPDKALGAVLDAAGSPIPDPLDTLAEDIRSEIEEAVGRDADADAEGMAYNHGGVAGLSVAADLVAKQQRLMQEIQDSYFNEPGVAWSPEGAPQ